MGSESEPAPGLDDAVERQLLSTVSRFAATLDGARADREARLPERVLAEAGTLGLFALTVPAEYGGLGLSLASACRVVERLATFDRSFAITVGLHAGLGTRGLIAHGSDALKGAWLPKVAEGACITAFAATEPGAGSDLTRMKTVLSRADGQLVLDGEKAYVTNGGFAGLFTVLASSPSMGGERGHTLLCVPADAPGVIVGREEVKLGIRASSTVTVRFDRVKLDDGQVLGEAGQGMTYAHGVLAWGRTLMAAGCVGTARAALDATVAHVTTRRQSGRMIGDFGASRAQVVTMARTILAMDALVMRAARAAGPRLDRDTLVAKVFCSEGAFAVCDRAVQLHGATGFLEPFGVARMLRDCRVTRIFEGANDVLLVRLGAARVGTAAPLADQVGGPCREVAARLDAEVAVLRARYGVSAVRHQLPLQRLARAEIAVLAADATRAEHGASRDAELAAFATAELLAEADEHLGAIAREGAREARVESLSQGIYGRSAVASSSAEGALLA